MFVATSISLQFCAFARGHMAHANLASVREYVTEIWPVAPTGPRSTRIDVPEFWIDATSSSGDAPIVAATVTGVAPVRRANSMTSALSAAPTAPIPVDVYEAASVPSV